MLRCTILCLSVAALLGAQSPRGSALTVKQRRENVESFEQVWRTVRDHHPDPALNGLNWVAVHDSALPLIQKAASIDQVRGVIRDMLARLASSHYAIIPGDLYSPVASEDVPSMAPRSSGITPVLIDGKAVVGSVEPDSSAARAGVKPGMVIDSINGASVSPLLRLNTEAVGREAERIVQRSVIRRLDSSGDGPTQIEVVDANGELRHIAMDAGPDAGKMVAFGNLPQTRVYFESRELAGGAGYIRFNEFLDPVSIMPRVEAAIDRFAKAPGMVLDLRGNPGGIGIMAMGIAGFFMDREGQKLGEMKMRAATLKFVIFPRPQTYTGPLAVLIDGGSASTAEILAQGLQDLGRARIFGTRSAGAALPSDIVRLPNGDGFQFAQASYTSEKGRVLEGNGVQPDVAVSQSQEALAAGHDLVIEAAAEWIANGAKR